MNYYNKFIYLVIFIKFIFIALSIYLVYIKRKEPNNKNKINRITHLKKKVETIFITCMSLLLIYLFNPRYTKNELVLDYETRLLLFLFGFILLITRDWESTIKKN
jgi:uncharacterized membrane protein YiaA